MTQSAPSLDAFFSGGGGRSVSWKDQPIGATVGGTIEAIHPAQQVTDPVSGMPKFKKDGVTPLMQVRIDLQTQFRNWELCRKPEDTGDGDDGRRSLYVGGWMTGAVGDAMRKAGASGAPQVGATLSVTLSERTPPDNPALNPTNKFTASYAPPSQAATAAFFDNTPAQPATPNGLSAPAAQAAEPLPPKPAAMSDVAWNAMPDATKRQVAAAMADAPPF